MKKHIDLRDFLVVFLCLSGIAFFAWSFQQDLNRALSRQNEMPVGTITYKYRAAQRRLANRVLWDRLSRESPVYDGDFIRTPEHSEARISITGGALIGLSENSFIQIFASGGGKLPSVELSSGGISLSAGEAGSLVLSSGENTVTLNPGAVLSAGMSTGSLVLLMNRGDAAVKTAESTWEAAAGTALSIDQAGLIDAVQDDAVRFLPPPVSQSPVPLPDREAPKPISPEEGRHYSYSETLPSVRFRWVSDSSPVQPSYYLLEAADNSRMDNPRLTFQTRTTSAVSSILDAGLWYWRVTPMYAGIFEGSGTPSIPVSFVVEENAALPAPASPNEAAAAARRSSGFRTIFPPDNYTITEDLLPDMRFTWKAEEPVRFQISQDQSFSSLAVDEKLAAEMYQIRRLGPGTWYWRISGSTETLPKKLIIAGAMEAPEPDRLQGGTMVIRKGEEGVFSWQMVKGADYYRFNLYQGEVGSNVRVYSNPRVESNSVSISMEGYEEGDYYWTVQGYTEESDQGSGRTGLISRTNFNLKADEPVAVAAPPPAPVRAPLAAPPPVVETPPPPPPLAAATGRIPANDSVFNAEFFRGRSSIAFSWNRVSGADAYTFTLYQQTTEGNRRIMSERVSTPSYVLRNLTVLSRGSFVWVVEAHRGTERGPEGENHFTVDIPEVRRNQLEDAGSLYGQ